MSERSRVLRDRLADGVDSYSPKDSIRKAGAAGLITNPDRWLGFVDLRNETSHTYTEKLAEAVYKHLNAELIDDLRALLANAGDAG